MGFSKDGIIKIMDFGLAREIERISSHEENQVFKMSGGTGSLRYMAPEVVNCAQYNHKVDVYSFGIILWEMLSCSKPFAGLNAPAFYSKVVKMNHRPPINKKWPQKLAQITEQCWTSNIHERPSFEKIYADLAYYQAENYGDGKTNAAMSLIRAARRSSVATKPVLKNPKACRRMSAIA